MDSKPESPPPFPIAVLHRVEALDTEISLKLYTFFHPIFPYPLLKSLEFSGDGRIFFPILLSVLLTTAPIASLSITPVTPSTLLALNLLIGGLLDLILVGSIKHLVQRPRPVYNKNMFLSFAVDHWSFPSGHSSRVSFIACYCLLYSNQIREVLLMSPLEIDPGSFILEYFVVGVGIWAAITSLSRVFLGRHFVLDIVAGLCLGAIEGMIVFRFLNFVNLCSWFR